MSMPRPAVLLMPAAILTLLAPYPAVAKQRGHKPLPCAGGRFLVDRNQVVTGDTSPSFEAIQLDASAITVSLGCSAVRPKLKRAAHGAGTKVHAAWPGCGALLTRKGRPAPTVLNGFIAAPDCSMLQGTLVVKKSNRKKRPFTATLSRCGDGRFDPGNGEQCDGAQGCAMGSHCTASCKCEAGVAYTVHTDEIAGGVMVVGPISHTPAGASGSLMTLTPTTGTTAHFLIDTNGDPVAADVLVSGKNSLSFDASHTAQAFVLTNAAFFGWTPDRLAAVYAEIAQHPLFPTLVSQILAGHRLVADDPATLDLANRIAVDVATQFSQAQGSAANAARPQVVVSQPLPLVPRLLTLSSTPALPNRLTVTNYGVLAQRVKVFTHSNMSSFNWSFLNNTPSNATGDDFLSAPSTWYWLVIEDIEALFGIARNRNLDLDTSSGAMDFDVVPCAYCVGNGGIHDLAENPALDNTLSLISGLASLVGLDVTGALSDAQKLALQSVYLSFVLGADTPLQITAMINHAQMNDYGDAAHDLFDFFVLKIDAVRTVIGQPALEAVFIATAARVVAPTLPGVAALYAAYKAAQAGFVAGKFISFIFVFPAEASGYFDVAHVSVGSCTPATTQPCYTGPAGTSGVGACQPGTATCLDDGSAFGDCEGEVLPSPEICNDGIDNDCDGLTDVQDSECQPAFTLQKVVASGDAIGSTTFSDILDPVQRLAAGDFAFRAQLTAGGEGLFEVAGGPVTSLVTTSDQSPVGGSFADFAGVPTTDHVLGRSGTTIVFTAHVADGSSSAGIFQRIGSAAVSPLAVQGDAVPDARIGGSLAEPFSPPTMNASANIGFTAGITNAAASQGIFVKTGSSLTAFVATGDPSPITISGSPTVFGSFADANLLDDGSAAAFAGSCHGFDCREGLFHFAVSGPAKVVIEGDQISTGEHISGFCGATDDPASGLEIVSALLDTGVWDILSAAPGVPPAPLLIGGTPTNTRLGGTFGTVGCFSSLADDGRVVFSAEIAGGISSKAIFSRATDGTLSVVAAVGDATPIGGTFTDFGTSPADDSGRVVFWASVQDGSAPDGIFLATPR